MSEAALARSDALLDLALGQAKLLKAGVDGLIEENARLLAVNETRAETIKELLREISRLHDENFALAANQCQAPIFNEFGHTRCGATPGGKP